jgi:hypothetical protein
MLLIIFEGLRACYYFCVPTSYPYCQGVVDELCYVALPIMNTAALNIRCGEKKLWDGNGCIQFLVLLVNAVEYKGAT